MEGKRPLVPPPRRSESERSTPESSEEGSRRRRTGEKRRRGAAASSSTPPLLQETRTTRGALPGLAEAAASLAAAGGVEALQTQGERSESIEPAAALELLQHHSIPFFVPAALSRALDGMRRALADEAAEAAHAKARRREAEVRASVPAPGGGRAAAAEEEPAVDGAPRPPRLSAAARWCVRGEGYRDAMEAAEGGDDGAQASADMACEVASDAAESAKRPRVDGAPAPPLPPPAELGWRAPLAEALRRLRECEAEWARLGWSEMDARLRGAFDELAEPPAELERGAPLTKARVCAHNMAHLLAGKARRLKAELMAAWDALLVRSALALNLSAPLRGGAIALNRTLQALYATPCFRDYCVMTKPAYNEVVGQKQLWTAGERKELLQRLCTRPDATNGGKGRTWITLDYFTQHTSRDTAEVFVLVHIPTMRIDALASVADFQPPWTAAQFHHMAHACQEDRMFFFGRRSEVKTLPRARYDSANSFEGATRFSSHFHMPSLLSVDIICAMPGVRGLAALLLAHIACLQSAFLNDRTHMLFDISGREANTRMVRFTQSIGAQRYQTFADEARSEGFIGVEGDDPSIFWTYKTPTGYGPNEGRTAGPYAIDVESGEPITALHPAVLFDDRVTVHDFHRPGSSSPLLDANAVRVAGRNCSYFAIAPVESIQSRLGKMLERLREECGQMPVLPLEQRWSTGAPAAVETSRTRMAPGKLEAKASQPGVDEVAPVLPAVGTFGTIVAGEDVAAAAALAAVLAKHPPVDALSPSAPVPSAVEDQGVGGRRAKANGLAPGAGAPTCGAAPAGLANPSPALDPSPATAATLAAVQPQPFAAPVAESRSVACAMHDGVRALQVGNGQAELIPLGVVSTPAVATVADRREPSHGV